MKLLDKIKSAETKKELDSLAFEIIMSGEDFAENQREYIKRMKEIGE